MSPLSIRNKPLRSEPQSHEGGGVFLNFSESVGVKTSIRGLQNKNKNNKQLKWLSIRNNSEGPLDKGQDFSWAHRQPGIVDFGVWIEFELGP